MDAELKPAIAPRVARPAPKPPRPGALVRSLDDLRVAAREFVADPRPTLVDMRMARNVVSVPYRRLFYGQEA